MSDYAISQVYPSDKRSLAGVDALLHREGITRDGNLDYICAMTLMLHFLKEEAHE